jgi:hypothetical protein
MWRTPSGDPEDPSSSSTPVSSRRRLLLGLAVVLTVAVVLVGAALLAAGIVGGWLSDQEAAGWPALEGFTTRPQTEGPPPMEVACLPDGPRFLASYLDGPELTRAEFLATPLGQTVDGFFTPMPPGQARRAYRAAEGFTVVSDSLVLGFGDGVPTLLVNPSDWTIHTVPGCYLRFVVGDWVATRWFLEEPVDADTTILHIGIAAGACVTSTGTEVTTELGSKGIIDGSESVSITMWATERRPPASATTTTCAGIGAVLHDEVTLEEPLGDRLLLDGGFVPPFVIDRQPWPTAGTRRRNPQRPARRAAVRPLAPTEEPRTVAIDVPRRPLEEGVDVLVGFAGHGRCPHPGRSGQTAVS